MKKIKIVYWVTTIMIVLFEGVIPLLTSQTELAKSGITNLGYPLYFGNILVVFKVLGAAGLIIPAVKGNAKEWVYAGFGFDFIFAFLSVFIVSGFMMSILALVCMALLVLSYRSYHKIVRMKQVL